VTEPEARRGFFAELLHHERRLLPRLEGVMRFDPQIYREIEADPHAIPQALAVVVTTAVIAALGQGGLVLMFLGLAWVIVVWMALTALLWAVGRFAVERHVEFAALLRCTGFAYIWFALFLLEGLPGIGFLFPWAAVGLALGSLVVATREVLETDSTRALVICSIALGVPFVALYWLTG
jgi:hypothetical protein